MKKIKYLSLIICLMLMPIFCVHAEEIEESKEESEIVEQIKKFHVVAGDAVTSSSNVDGSSIVAGNNVTAENTVDGIDMVFGQTVTYNGNSDYTVVAGENVNINGTTNNDGFIFGSNITFDKNYKATRDIFVLGSTVILRGELNRDATIFASSVVLEDVQINGNITIYATNIEVKNANIEKLSYDEEAIITISDESIVGEKITITSKISENSQFNIFDSIINYLGVLVLFAVIAIVFPSLFKKIETKTNDMSIMKFISMIGYGLFFLIIIPVAAVFLLVMPITQLLSIVILGLYIVVIVSYNILAGYLIGLLVWKKIIKKDINILLVGLLGISILTVLQYIPYINVIVILMSILLSLSIFIKLFTKDA